jgi:dTMP kinase
MSSVTKGKFIVFEGLDGCGKTTQVKLFKEYLESQKRKVIATHEPTDESDAGQRIRRVLQHKESFPTMEEFQMLYVEDRKIHTARVILPALENGIDVIGDRYYLSTVAFGSIGGCDIEWLHEINAEFPRPDITFIIDVEPATCLERQGKKGEGLEYFERQKRFGHALETYRAMVKKHNNVFLINGNRDVDSIFADVISLSEGKI